MSTNFINPMMNPNINPMANPNINPMMNPNINPMANPNINPMMNPMINPMAQPVANPKIGESPVTSSFSSHNHLSYDQPYNQVNNFQSNLTSSTDYHKPFWKRWF